MSSVPNITATFHVHDAYAIAQRQLFALAGRIGLGVVAATQIVVAPSAFDVPVTSVVAMACSLQSGGRSRQEFGY